MDGVTAQAAGNDWSGGGLLGHRWGSGLVDSLSETGYHFIAPAAVALAVSHWQHCPLLAHSGEWRGVCRLMGRLPLRGGRGDGHAALAISHWWFCGVLTHSGWRHRVCGFRRQVPLRGGRGNGHAALAPSNWRYCVLLAHSGERRGLCGLRRPRPLRGGRGDGHAALAISYWWSSDTEVHGTVVEPGHATPHSPRALPH